MEELKEKLTFDEIVDEWIVNKERTEVADLIRRMRGGMEQCCREIEMRWTEKEVIEWREKREYEMRMVASGGNSRGFKLSSTHQWMEKIIQIESWRLFSEKFIEQNSKCQVFLIIKKRGETAVKSGVAASV